MKINNSDINDEGLSEITNNIINQSSMLITEFDFKNNNI